MRPGTHVLISGERVRGRVAPDREPTYGIRPDCTIATGTCDCPPCTRGRQRPGRTARHQRPPDRARARRDPMEGPMSITSIHDVTDEWVGRHVRVTRLDDGATNTGVIRHVRRTDEYTSVDLTQPDGETWWGALVVYRPGVLADWERTFGMDDLSWIVERLPDLPARHVEPAPYQPKPDLRETHE